MKHDLFLIADECYKEFIYDGAQHKSILEYSDISDAGDRGGQHLQAVQLLWRPYRCTHHSKSRCLPGGFKICSSQVVPSFHGAEGGAGSLSDENDYFTPIRIEYQRRRDVLYEGLQDIPGIVMHKPQGAFYITVKLPIKDCEHFVRWMLTDFRLDNETVMVAPAQGFYSTPGKGMDEVRIAYVLKEEDLKRALVVFKAGLKKYQELFL